MSNSLISKLKQNWQSGLTVALVSIPLSISLAVASHASPITGIITAIWAGMIASLFGGSNYNIVGPTGALSGILATYAIINGADTLPMLSVVAGAMIMIAYALRLERYLVLIPSSVIHGFTLGVAFIIGFNQFNFAFGLSGLMVHEKFFDNLVESLKHVGDVSVLTLVIFLAFLLGLFVLRKIAPKLPGAVLLTPVGIFLGYLSTKNMIPVALATLGTKFGTLQFEIFKLPHLAFSRDLWVAAITVAVIAILETMLSPKIADGMTHTKHNGRAEMRGLGLANIVSGLMGGMPATAALARTSLNIKSGATHAYSATLSTIFIAIISIFLLSSFTYIPLAVIAAILVYVAIQMIEMEHFIKYFEHDKSGFLIAMLVAGVTVYEDPIVGMMLGTMIAMLLFVERLSHGHFDITLNSFKRGQTLKISGTQLAEEEVKSDFSLYSIRGKLCYVNSKSHIARFETNFRKHNRIILRLREVYFIDIDGVDAVDEIIDIVEGRGQQILLSGVIGDTAEMLAQLSEGYMRLKEKGLVFEKSQDAIDYLKEHRHVKIG
jgi:SulP family sulfate permease